MAYLSIPRLARLNCRKVAQQGLPGFIATRRHLTSDSATTTPSSTSGRQGLNEWIASPPTATSFSTLHHEHLADLFITLPTRDGGPLANGPFEEPAPGQHLPYGHHLAFFHRRRPESELRGDGTDAEVSPPAPYLQRMWAGGKVKWDVNNPLVVGTKTTSSSKIVSVVEKGVDKGNPMLFVMQEIQYTREGKESPSVVEERQHVFFPKNRVVQLEPRRGTISFLSQVAGILKNQL